jgi:hypothetical protein
MPMMNSASEVMICAFEMREVKELLRKVLGQL